MDFVNYLPWDTSSEMQINEDSTQCIQNYMVLVRYQCTLPVWVTVSASTCGTAVQQAQYRLGRLAKGNLFASVVLRIDGATGILYRCVDDRPNFGSDYVV